MQERSGAFLWLVGMCTLLLSSAGFIYLLVRQGELTEELLRLQAQVKVLAQSRGLQDGTSLQAEGLKKLQRSRRNQEEEEGQDEKDMLMLTTFSMVPVRHQNPAMGPVSSEELQQLSVTCLVGLETPQVCVCRSVDRLAGLLWEEPMLLITR